MPADPRLPSLTRQLSVESPSLDDTASTVSFHESDVSDNPEDMWMTLGLIALETPAQPRRRWRLNTLSTEASSHYQDYDSDRLSYASGCQTPDTDSN